MPNFILGVYRIPAIFSNSAPDPVLQYFDFPIYHVETGSGSSISSLWSVTGSGRMQLEPKPAPDPAGFKESEFGIALLHSIPSTGSVDL